MNGAAADLALESYLRGQTVVVASAGVAACIVTLLLIRDPLTWGVSATAGMTVGLLVAWLIVRGTRRGRYDDLAVADALSHRPPAVAVRLGAIRGLLGTGATLLVVLGERYLEGVDAYRLVGPILLAAAVSLVYSRRRLVEWQQRHGRLVCTRAGVGRFAWTRRQARSRTVTIPLAVD